MELIPNIYGFRLGESQEVPDVGTKKWPNKKIITMSPDGGDGSRKSAEATYKIKFKNFKNEAKVKTDKL